MFTSTCALSTTASRVDDRACRRVFGEHDGAGALVEGCKPSAQRRSPHRPVSWRPFEDELRLLTSKHGEGRHTPNAKTDAGVGDLDLLRRGGGDLVGHHGVAVGERVSHEVVVCYLEERADCGGFVALTRRPDTDRAERGQHGRVWPEKEPRAALAGPGRKLVVARVDLIADLLDAEDA